MNGRALAGAAFVSALLYWGCRDESERPPLTETCTSGPGCLPPKGGVIGPGEGGAGSDGPSAGGDAGSFWSGGAPDEIVGVVRELSDDRFDRTIAFTNTAIIEAEGEEERFARATYNGFDPFVLRDFQPADPIWVLARPEENRGVLPTMHPIDPRAAFADEPIDFGLVRADTLDVIFGLAVDQAPNGRLPGTGQAILWFTDSRGEGIPGIEVTFPEAELVSYGGTWVSGETQTDQSGLVLLGNVVTPAFPGSTKRVRLSGAATGYVLIRVASNAVSLVQVPLR